MDVVGHEDQVLVRGGKDDALIARVEESSIPPRRKVVDLARRERSPHAGHDSRRNMRIQQEPPHD